MGTNWFAFLLGIKGEGGKFTRRDRSTRSCFWATSLQAELKIRGWFSPFLKLQEASLNRSWNFPLLNNFVKIIIIFFLVKNQSNQRIILRRNKDPLAALFCIFKRINVFKRRGWRYKRTLRCRRIFRGQSCLNSLQLSLAHLIARKKKETLRWIGIGAGGGTGLIAPNLCMV